MEGAVTTSEVLTVDSRDDQSSAITPLDEDELDMISGGLPGVGNLFSGEPHTGRFGPKLPVLQDRPSDDPDLWF
jgi:hypothetical protein